MMKIELIEMISTDVIKTATLWLILFCDVTLFINAKGSAKVHSKPSSGQEQQRVKQNNAARQQQSSGGTVGGGGGVARASSLVAGANNSLEQQLQQLAELFDILEIFIVGCPAKFQFRNSSYEEKLLIYLLRDYDPVARAVVSTDKSVVVSIDFVLLRIHGLDERTQVLTTTGLVIAEWKDERLCWNPEHFGNLTSIIIKADKIWLPELAVMNGADELMPDFERIRVLLHSDGRLHWEPGGIFRTTCDIDIAFFPFDKQHCYLLIGAYSYYSSKMNITNTSTTIHTHDFSVNGEWEVYNTAADWNITILRNSSGDGYSHVVFTLHLKRRYKFYIMNIVLPCVMLSVLIMIGFCLPPDAGEKISLGISVLLAFTVFLVMIADNIPRTSLAIPVIVIYLMATMTLGTFSVCMTVLVLNVHHRGPRSNIPPALRRLVLVYLARFFCIDTVHGRPRHRPHPPRLSSMGGREVSQQADEVWKRRPRLHDSASLSKPCELAYLPQRQQMSRYPERDVLPTCHDVTTILPPSRPATLLAKKCNYDGGGNCGDEEGTAEFENLNLMRNGRSRQMISLSSLDSPCHMSRSVGGRAGGEGERCDRYSGTRSDKPWSRTTARSSRSRQLGRNCGSCCSSYCTGSEEEYEGEDCTGGGRERGEEEEGSSGEEWRELARVLDRAFFWLLFALMTISALTILLYPIYSGGGGGE